MQSDSQGYTADERILSVSQYYVERKKCLHYTVTHAALDELWASLFKRKRKKLTMCLSISVLVAYI